MRSRRELENTFDSIADLVAVSDRRGPYRPREPGVRVAGRAAAARQLLDRPLADFIGPELAAWLARHESAAEPGARRRSTREIVDPVLKGTFIVTVTDLLNHDRERGRPRHRRARHDAADAARGRARGAAQAADAVREAGGARPVRGRHRPRAEQPAAGRARATSSCCARPARFPSSCGAKCRRSTAKPIAPRRSCGTCWSSPDRGVWRGAR